MKSVTTKTRLAYRFIDGILPALVALAATSAASPAQAVMMRHDVAPERYERLAAEADYLRPGRVILLDARGNYSGVVIGGKYVLTAGHPVVGMLPAGAVRGPVTVRVIVQEREYKAEYAFLCPEYDRSLHRGGADLAILRLTSVAAAAPINSALIWSGGLHRGDRFVGIGQGKSGTGLQNDEPLPMGVFRGYENTIDYIYPADDHGLGHFRSDFDDGSDTYNTLARTLLGEEDGATAAGAGRPRFRGQSSPRPLPLEGTIAAGDSGSGIWVKRGGGGDSAFEGAGSTSAAGHPGTWYLAGIASYRYFSMYGGQAGYVNLGHPVIAAWLRLIARDEGTSFKTASSIPVPLPQPQPAGNSAPGTTGARSFQAAPSYRVIDLGLLPGAKRGAPVEATALNSRGLVVGGCGQKPFWWTAKTGMRPLPIPGGSKGNALAVNDAGWAVGFCDSDACAWTPEGKFIRIGHLPGHTSARATAIGPDNTVYGFSSAGGYFTRRAFFWRPSGDGGDRAAIQDAGTSFEQNPGQQGIHSAFLAAKGRFACGFTTALATPSSVADRACLWEAGSGFRVLPTPVESPESVATSVNSLGDAVGHISTSSNGMTASLWREGAATALDLGKIEGGQHFGANAVNEARQVLGAYHDSQGRGRVFYWSESTGMRPVEDLLEPNSRRWYVEGVMGMNDRGQFVGMCSLGDKGYAYIAMPVQRRQ